MKQDSSQYDDGAPGVVAGACSTVGMETPPREAKAPLRKTESVGEDALRELSQAVRKGETVQEREAIIRAEAEFQRVRELGREDATTQTATLFSGSSGNALVAIHPEGSVLIDVGNTCKRVEEALRDIAVDPTSLIGILLSHEHSDHARGLSVFARRYNLPVFCGPETWAALNLSEKERSLIHFQPVEAEESFELGPWRILPIRTSHDAASPLAYKLDAGSGVLSVLTDSGQVTPWMLHQLRGTDFCYIEANYDEGMLWNGPYPWPLKRRIASQNGHLSNLSAAAVITHLYEQGCEAFVLTHLSETNNTPELAYETVASCLEAHDIVPGEDLELNVAPRYRPSLRYDIKAARPRASELRERALVTERWSAEYRSWPGMD